MKKCERCGKDIDGSYGSGRFCNISCARSIARTEEDKKNKSEAAKNSNKVKLANINRMNKYYDRLTDRINTIHICPKCGIEFKTTTKKKFCSRKCANSRTWTEEDKKKKSITAKNSEKVKNANNKQRGLKTAERVTKQCPICKKEFIRLKSQEKITCSQKCGYKLKGVYGGYREGSGRSKHGYYKGVYCGSTYELVYVIYRLDHDLTVNRFNR